MISGKKMMICLNCNWEKLYFKGKRDEQLIQLLLSPTNQKKGKAKLYFYDEMCPAFFNSSLSR
eukprot:m.11431 g.11431  ORF g.11431 m.11431 type:complete len:63 (+) comp9815_c0_seq2:647-835(+)